MKLTADRYTRLSRAYLTLADKFQQLDIEHMTFKQQIVPLLKALKHYQQQARHWQQEKAQLVNQIRSLEEKQVQLESALAVATTREHQLTERLQGQSAETATLQSTLNALQKAKTALEATVESLSEEKATLQTEVGELASRCETLSPFAGLLDTDSVAALADAETQLELVEETLAEMSANPTPDLSPIDQALLSEFEAGQFLIEGGSIDAEPKFVSSMASVTPLPTAERAYPHSA